MKKSQRSAARARKKRKARQRCQLRDVVSPRLTEAAALWRQGAHAKALQCYEAAVRAEPGNVRVLVEAARAHAYYFQLERAEQLLGQLRGLSASHPGPQHLAGEVYSLLRLPEKARECFEYADRLAGVLPRTRIELASLYERVNRLDEAGELIERALKTDPHLPAALLVRARLQRRQNRWDAAEATLRSLIERVAEDDEAACQAWAEIAAIRDRQGDFSGAVAAIERCKRVQLGRSDAEWKASEHVLRRFCRMVDSITQADFDRWHQSAGELTDGRVALLTGFPRSGTTLVEKVLAAHPDLVSTEECDYLARVLFPSLHAPLSLHAPVQQVLDQLSLERIRQERERYLRIMEELQGEPLDGRLHLDKNPAYNLMIPLVLRLFPEAKLVVVLRDPRDVVLSCYLRYLPVNPVSVRFLSIERTAERYALDMRAWLKFREMIHARWVEIRYEDTVADLATEAGRALQTLGLSWTDSVLSYRDRLDGKQVLSPSYEAVVQPVYTKAIGRWKSYQRELAPVLPLLEPFVEAFGYV